MAVRKVGLRPIKEGDEPLKVTEGFNSLPDTDEALREMREAEGGGVLATAAEQEELEAALEDEAGGGEGPSNPADPGAGARYDDEQAEKRKQAAAAAAEDVEVEVELNQQFSDVLSPSKPPLAKKPKKGGGGAGTSSQPIEFTESQE